MATERRIALAAALATLGAASSARAEDKHDHPWGLVMGAGISAAGATGTSSDVYGPGAGMVVMLGVGYRKTSVEMQGGVGFGALPRYTALRGATTRGSYGLRSLVVRQTLLDAKVGASVFAGVAGTSLPLLVASVDDITGATTFESDVVDGTGVTAGGGATYALTRHVRLAADLALYAIEWQLPPAPYVQPADGTATDATAVPYTQSTDDISATPWSMTVSVRLVY